MEATPFIKGRIIAHSGAFGVQVNVGGDVSAGKGSRFKDDAFEDSLPECPGMTCSFVEICRIPLLHQLHAFGKIEHLVDQGILFTGDRTGVVLSPKFVPMFGQLLGGGFAFPCDETTKNLVLVHWARVGDVDFQMEMVGQDGIGHQIDSAETSGALDDAKKAGPLVLV